MLIPGVDVGEAGETTHSETFKFGSDFQSIRQLPTEGPWDPEKVAKGALVTPTGLW